MVRKISGTTAGIFINPNGKDTNGIGTSSFSYGTGDSSRLKFLAENFSIIPGNIFNLGELTYYNGVTGGDEGDLVQLNFQFNLDGKTYDTIYDLNLINTPNTGSSEENADYVKLGVGKTFDVKVGKYTYALEVLGFGSISADGASSDLISEFHVLENTSDSANLIGRFTKFDFAAKSLEWGGAQGGLSFNYNITGDTLEKDIKSFLKLSWESSSNAKIKDVDLSSIEFPFDTGSHTVNIPGNLLKNAPNESDHLSLVFNEDEELIEINEDNNQVIISDVSLVRASTARGVISDYSQSILKELLREAGEDKVVITSLQRTAEDQARIMFDNILKEGVSKQKKLYAAAGDSVIDVYVKETKGLNKTEIINNRESIQQAMLDKIYSIGAVKVSRHISDPNKLQVIDLAPSSFKSQSKPLFVNAANEEVGKQLSKFLSPEKGDPAYHIEIVQIGVDDTPNHV